MDLVHQKPVKSPHLEGVTLRRFAVDGEMLIEPDGCWDIAVLKQGDNVRVLRTGLTTRAVTYRHSAGDEMLVIAFKPSAFMPLMPGELMRNKGMLLETFGRRNFHIGADVWEVPTFDNADVFVERLVREQVIQANEIVASVLAGEPKAMSERTLQRHFMRTTGLTYKAFTVVERAQKAASLLRMGQPAADVAFALGYADQAHMINSLKVIMGQTPGQIAKTATT